MVFVAIQRQLEISTALSLTSLMIERTSGQRMISQDCPNNTYPPTNQDVLVTMGGWYMLQEFEFQAKKGEERRTAFNLKLYKYLTLSTLTKC